MKLPLVAIVGRPNVGKSTLFNRITHSRKAITSPESGVTRDRHVESAEWQNRKFLVMDTGGWMPGSDDMFESAIHEQVQFALEECDLIVFVGDVQTGPTDVDAQIAKMLQKSKKPVLLAINKVDGPKQDPEVFEFYKLALGDPYSTSAVGGTGVAELMNEILDKLPEAGSADELSRPRPWIAIVGRPNVGKSSFANAISQTARHIVTEVAGTTRDAIDTQITYYGQPVTLIDTAGLRRKSKVNEAVEFYTTVRTRRALEECDVAIILIDAVDELVAQDIDIIQDAAALGKGMILCINKWDLVEKDNNTASKIKKAIDEKISSFSFVPKFFISSTEKQRVYKVLETSMKIYEERKKRISTSELNRFIAEMMELNYPPSIKARDLRLTYATQASDEPPLFIFFSKWPELMPDNYVKFLERKLREQYGFEGVPVKLAFRKKQ